MDEHQLAALAAATGETDPDKIVAAVTGLKGRATATEASLAKMTEERAAAFARAEAAEKRADGMERDAEIAAAKADRKWTPALEGFLASLSVEQLKTWRANAPVAVPGGEIQPPAEAPTADTQLAPDVAQIVAKARQSGWKALTATEKHTLSTQNPKLATQLRKG